MAVDSFTGKLAVVTGGGSGMGRELVRQLAAQGCSVAACDLNADAIAVTAATSWAAAPPGVRVTGHACDVSDEAQVLRFRDELLEQHASDHVDLVFSNAGVGGGESFIAGRREVWERTFAIDWWGVYYCARAFLPLLIASSDGVLVNTSSVNGFWASLGPGIPQTAYSTAKFAVRGFSEALIEDLRANAPHVRVAVVLPGHVGTDLVANSLRARGLPEPGQMSDAQLEEVIPRDAQAKLIRAGLLAEGAGADELRQILVQANADFRDKAPVSAAEAATIILDGVRSGTWRILIGEDAKKLDVAVRAKPEAAYDYAELDRKSTRLNSSHRHVVLPISSSSTGCDPAPGGSSSARTPRSSTWRCARSPRPPMTTPSCSAGWQQSRRRKHLSSSSQRLPRRWSEMGVTPCLSRPDVLDDIIMSDSKVFQADLARSVPAVPAVPGVSDRAGIPGAVLHRAGPGHHPSARPVRRDSRTGRGRCRRCG